MQDQTSAPRGFAEPAPISVKGPGLLERMPKWLIYIPLTLQWLWLALRYGSATLPTAANPTITAGGLVGEGKLEYFNGMGPVARTFTAAHGAIYPCIERTPAALNGVMAEAGLTFPVIAKPDKGMCGYGVRLIANLSALRAYLQHFPDNGVVILQQYLPQSGEAGIFYARNPGANQGRIIGLALRYFPQVKGDGHSTLATLVAADPRAARVLTSDRHECGHDLKRIPARGEVVRLATIGSTRIGGLYRDGQIFITPKLSAAIDSVAQDMPLFFFGRFDVRFDTLKGLGDGSAFTIMEVNGAGSEAIQAWDPDIGLIKAFGMIFAKQRLLFAIGDACRKKGFKPMRLLTLARLNWSQQKLLSCYPPSN